MKRFVCFAVLMMLFTVCDAQEKKFSPEKFEAELAEYVKKPANEEGCAAAIRERDKLEIELKQLEQCYHKKMIQVIPASKVYDCINAENRFHRKKMKGWQRGKR